MSISGRRLAAVINGTPVDGLHGWEADDSGTDQLDATTGRDQGFTDTDIGCVDLRVTLHLYFDLTEGLGGDLRVGSELADVKLYRHEDDATPAYDIPLAVVVSKPQRAEVRGKLEETAVIKNKGAYSELAG